MTVAIRTTPALIMIAVLGSGCFRTDVLGEDQMNGASGMGAGAGSMNGMAGESGSGGMAGSSGMSGGASGMAGGGGMAMNPMGMDPEPCSTPLTAKQVDVGVDDTCAVTDDGALYCWGREYVSDESVMEPRQITGIMGEVRSVALGGYFGCALTVQGMVWCWGINDRGELGNGTTDDSADPTPVLNLTDVEQIAAGFSHACAIRQGGEVWCWGDNEYGQLGEGGATLTEPVAVWTSSDLAVQVTGGYEHTCIRNDDDRVNCIGVNVYGQLGNGTNVSTSEFVGLDIAAVDVSAGLDHTCAVDDQGDVWCWGSNSAGQLGDGTTGGPIGAGMPTGRTSPVRALDLHGMTEVHAAHDHTCAVSQMGIVSCWGSNQFGALAVGSDDPSLFELSPREATGIGGSISSIATGGSHNCVIKSTGELLCWGHNEYGAVGDGTGVNRFEPAPVVGFACE